MQCEALADSSRVSRCIVIVSRCVSVLRLLVPRRRISPSQQCSRRCWLGRDFQRPVVQRRPRVRTARLVDAAHAAAFFRMITAPSSGSKCRCSDWAQATVLAAACALRHRHCACRLHRAKSKRTTLVTSLVTRVYPCMLYKTITRLFTRVGPL